MIMDCQVESSSESEDEAPSTFRATGSLLAELQKMNSFPIAMGAMMTMMTVTKVLQYKSTQLSSPKVYIRSVPMNVSFLYLISIAFYSCRQNSFRFHPEEILSRTILHVSKFRSRDWYRSEGNCFLV